MTYTKFEWKEESLEEMVLGGLSKESKELPAKILYDKKGSELFEEICAQPEYYVPECELEILASKASDIARSIGEDCDLIELGSGAGVKVQSLLNTIPQIKSYVGIDISETILRESCLRLEEMYPSLDVYAICTDFTQQLEIPESFLNGDRKRISYFPGSTIGNFDPSPAIELLKKINKMNGPKGGLLVGADLEKDPQTLLSAYDDRKGVTAAFSLNVLDRMNRELSANFDKNEFKHVVEFNKEKHRIEIFIESQSKQDVTVANKNFSFEKGERIHTESSHKYTIPRFEKLCAEAGFQLKEAWKDQKEYFSIQYYEAA